MTDSNMDDFFTNVPQKKDRDTTQVLQDPSKDRLRVRKARLEIVAGPDTGLVKDLEYMHTVVGSSPGCNLVLTDRAISRKHFELHPVRDGYRLRDLGSKNGTVVRGIKANDAILRGGEEIEVGWSRLLFTFLDDHTELPLSPKHSFGEMVGRSAAMRQVFAVLERAAQTDSTLLLEGESGTGKDLAAECVHQHSPRKDKAFVIIDCSAFTPTLIEDELFGHCKGAFTGANRDRMGVFESANLGTVFLDEISVLDLSLQPKLLRLLEKMETRRLGENTYRKVNVRILAATNRDLATEVQQGRFRDDLFYRLSVLRVHLPPLRDRAEDIADLAKKFVKLRDENLDPNEVITSEVMGLFVNHNWPGNVRELRNVIERLLLFPEQPHVAIRRLQGGTGDISNQEDLFNLPFRQFQKKYQERYEKIYLTNLLDNCNNNLTKAALKADIPRQTLYRLLEKYKLK